MLGTDTPNYHAPTMEAGGNTALRTAINGAMNSSPEKMQASYQPPSASGLLKDDGGFNEGLAYKNPMSAAIQARTMSGFQKEEQKLNAEVKNQSRNAYFDRLSQAASLAQQEQQMNFEKEMARRRAKEAKKQARGQIIGTILGVAGAGAGAMMGGGPVGAVAGAQLGSSVGNIAGQGM